MPGPRVAQLPSVVGRRQPSFYIRLCSELGQSVNEETKARKRKRAFFRGADCRFLIPSQRAYISTARKLSPCVPRELKEYIASAYSSIKQNQTPLTLIQLSEHCSVFLGHRHCLFEELLGSTILWRDQYWFTRSEIYCYI